MELSLDPVPGIVPAPAARAMARPKLGLAFGGRAEEVGGGTEPLFLDVEVPLPAALAHLGGSTRATATGNPKGKTVVVLGGISGNRFVAGSGDGAPGWWPGLVGSGRAVDPARHLIVGLDFAADSAGRVAPTTAEQAQVLLAALDRLGRARADVVIGASYGGMVALALAEIAPARVGSLIVISAGGEPHPLSTANRELQRRVVALGIESGKADEALAIARGMAMLTYRTPDEFAGRFEGGIDACCPHTASAPGAYLRARGSAFRAVMSPERFLSLSGSIDRHRVDPSRIACPVLLIGADSDQLVPPDQMRALAGRLAGPSELHLLPCLYGHDMFLKEAEAVGRIIAPFLAR
ncbi:homoserine O-succinyltransferase [Sphingomonas parva]|uniref:Homoserine O-succinyltransferase n=1 Tax=Sphingomonas parva TaxID=2555898 RepID=A0A4Y8ZTW7_9SPHN|nr:homoserine O-succinyltransferase [Sphingomonas parva]TFI59451.1 homoserine O-succinyltransferase [Sphingomonas parva]